MLHNLAKHACLLHKTKIFFITTLKIQNKNFCTRVFDVCQIFVFMQKKKRFKFSDNTRIITGNTRLEKKKDTSSYLQRLILTPSSIKPIKSNEN